MEQKYIKIDNELDRIRISFKENKFATKHLDEFECVFRKYSNIHKYHIFDLSTLTWIAHEELVYLSALFHQLFKNGIKFTINLKIQHKQYKGKDKFEERNKRTIVFLWENWDDFFKKEMEISTEETNNLFDVDQNYINQLKEELKSDNPYYVKIVPLKILPIKSVDEELLNDKLKDIYKLDKLEEDTQYLLKEHNSNTPLNNNTLSNIITKELYENTIEHAYIEKKGQRKVEYPACYMSVSLLRKMDESKKEIEEIQSIKKWQFDDESIPKSKSFYAQKQQPDDPNSDFEWKNQSYIQFTFMDFGVGIPYSLKTNDELSKKLSGKTDSEIIIDACSSFKSRHSIDEKFQGDKLPRGLFDMISIVQWYEGLVIIRSEKGKVLYDFSKGQNLKNCASSFQEKEEEQSFKGTIITILIPESSGIEMSKIRPISKDRQQQFEEIIKKDLLYIRILDVQRQARRKIQQLGEDMKKHLYNRTLEFLDKELKNKLRTKDNCCIIIDLNSCWGKDHGVVKKIIHFLILDNRFNFEKNVVIINPPSIEIISSIQLQLMSDEMRKLTQLPVPCIYREKGQVNIMWLGVDEKESFEKLNWLFIDEYYTLAKSDWESPDDTEKIKEAGLIQFDQYGNANPLFRIGDIEKKGEIIDIIDEKEREDGIKEKISKCIIDKITIERDIDGEISKEKEEVAFLCSGNYYQTKYLNIIESLYNREDVRCYATVLYEKLWKNIEININNRTKILSVTLSSQLLAREVINKFDDKLKENLKDNFIHLSNYHSYFLEQEFKKIKAKDEVLIICDVISTGQTIKSLKEKLIKIDAKLIGILALCDVRDQNSKEDFNVPFVSLSEIQMKKLKYIDVPLNIREDEKKIIRVNPATNALITMSEDKTERKATILIDDYDVFFKIANRGNRIKRGYFEDNQLFYPWYFDTRQILKNDEGRDLLREAIKRIKNLQNNSKNKIETDIDKINYVFYPIFSGAEEIDHNDYRDIFNEAEIYPIGRFSTPNGFRYTFPPKFLNDKTFDQNVLIFDGGSCSGATIIQMIDEISFLDVRSIVVLSVIGRNDDFMREFFSRTRRLKVKDLLIIDEGTNEPKKKRMDSVPLNIYFVSQWQIQTYNLGTAFPFYYENELLTYYENYNEIAHLPSLLINYIKKRKKKLKLHSINEKDKYDSLIPNDISNEDMLKMRNHLGEIAGYRFYKENFYHFNQFVIKYYKAPENKDLIREIELMLSVLLHEPYLIHSIRDFLPDVYAILKEFMKKIICGSEKYYGKNNIMNYEWSCASLLSIYLNLKKEDMNAIDESNFEIKSIPEIINFIESRNPKETENPLPIFFMFVLEFVPKKKEEIKLLQSKGISLRTELSKYIERVGNNGNSRPYNLPQIRIFYDLLNFLSFLNKNINDKDACKNIITQFYTDSEIIGKHEDSIAYLLITIHSNCDDLAKDISDENKKNENIENIKNCWQEVKNKLAIFCQHINRVEDFIELYNDNNLIEDISAIYKGYNDINEIIETNSIEENHFFIQRYTKESIINNLFGKNSIMAELFTKLTTKGIVEKYRKKFPLHRISNNCQINPVDNLEIDFPEKYFENIFMKELEINFSSHADDDSTINVEFYYEVNSDEIKLSIDNKKKNKPSEGHNHGKQIFDKLVELFKGRFSYDFPDVDEKDNFKQIYSFKIKK